MSQVTLSNFHRLLYFLLSLKITLELITGLPLFYFFFSFHKCIFNILNYVYVCLCAHECKCPWRLRGVILPWSWSYRWLEAVWYGHWEPSPGPQQEQYVISTSATSAALRDLNQCHCPSQSSVWSLPGPPRQPCVISTSVIVPAKALCDRNQCHCSSPVWSRPACTLPDSLSASLTVLARLISWHKFLTLNVHFSEIATFLVF